MQAENKQYDNQKRRDEARPLPYSNTDNSSLRPTRQVQHPARRYHAVQPDRRACIGIVYRKIPIPGHRPIGVVQLFGGTGFVGQVFNSFIELGKPVDRFGGYQIAARPGPVLDQNEIDFGIGQSPFLCRVPLHRFPVRDVIESGNLDAVEYFLQLYGALDRDRSLQDMQHLGEIRDCSASFAIGSISLCLRRSSSLR